MLITLKSLEKKSGDDWVDATADWDHNIWVDLSNGKENSYNMPGSITYYKIPVGSLTSGEYRLVIPYDLDGTYTAYAYFTVVE